MFCSGVPDADANLDRFGSGQTVTEGEIPADKDGRSAAPRRRGDAPPSVRHKASVFAECRCFDVRTVGAGDRAAGPRRRPG